MPDEFNVFLSTAKVNKMSYIKGHILQSISANNYDEKPENCVAQQKVKILKKSPSYHFHRPPHPQTF